MFLLHTMQPYTHIHSYIINHDFLSCSDFLHIVQKFLEMDKNSDYGLQS